MKLFIDKDAEIKVGINLTEDAKGKLVCWGDSEDAPEGFEKAKIDHHDIFFRVPSYKDNMLFLDAGLKVDGEGNLSIVSNQLKYTRLFTLLKSWTFKDDSGKEIPANKESLDALLPVICDTIASELGKALNSVG